MSSAGEKPSKRNQKACTTCRQVKLRCDSNERFPAPCTRCLKKNLLCRTDPDFKRTRTRHRLDEVTNQLNAIQKTLASQPERSASSVQHGSTPRPSSGIDLSVVEHEEYTFYGQSSTDSLPGFLAVLGEVCLDSEHVRSLFSHFASHYYKHCPILDTSFSDSQLYQLSPILFWTIIIISSRWHPTLHNQYGILLDPYRQLLGKTFVNHIFQLETIQALTLLCFWPLSLPRQVEDPSWNYCGLISNAALKLGLDRTGTGFSDRVSKIKRKTWIAIVQANCSHGWTSGMTVSSELLSSIDSSTIDCCTPVEKQFLVKAEMLRKLAKYCAIIINFKPDIASVSFVQGLCSDLDSTRGGSEDLWSKETTIISLGAQLCLYAVYLDQSRQKTSSAPDKRSGVFDKERASSRYDSITFAYMTAAKLIHRFSELVECGPPPGDGSQEAVVAPQRYLPKHYFGLLLVSMAVIFRTKLLYGSDTKKLPSDPAVHISQVYRILTSWSREPMDEPGRAASVMDVIFQADARGQLDMQVSNDEGRPGVAFLDEIIKTARRIREREGMTVDSGKSRMAVPQEHETDLTMETVASYSFEPLQDPSLEWNFPWGLDLLYTEQYGGDLYDAYNGLI